MKPRDFLELIGGTTLFFLSLVGSVILANRITRIFLPNASMEINLALLCVHLIVIVSFVMILRAFFHTYIKNKDVLNSIFTLTGPIIGLSSLYMSDTLHAMVNYYK